MVVNDNVIIRRHMPPPRINCEKLREDVIFDTASDTNLNGLLRKYALLDVDFSQPSPPSAAGTIFWHRN